MKAALGPLLVLLVLIGAVLAIGPALHDELYASAMLGAVVACGSAFALVMRLTVLERRLQRRERSVVGPVDQERLRNRVLLDHVPVPLLFLNVNGRLHVANRAARRLFGTENRVLSPPAALLQALDARNNTESTRIVRIVPAEGGLARSYRLSLSQGASLGGVMSYIALMDVDSELNEAAAQTLRDLLQVLGHEIMNSLTPVISLSATAEELCAEPPDSETLASIHEAVATIRRRAEGLESFVARYRALSRLPPPLRETTDIVALLTGTARLFEARFGARMLETVLPQEQIMMGLDRAQIEHAVTNLLINAAEAVESRAMPRVFLTALPDAYSVTITIGDNGAGLDPANSARIFDPFISFKPQGSGIGLSLSRQIVHGHGGTIWTELGDGAPWVTLFKIRLCLEH